MVESLETTLKSKSHPILLSLTLALRGRHSGDSLIGHGAPGRPPSGSCRLYRSGRRQIEGIKLFCLSLLVSRSVGAVSACLPFVAALHATARCHLLRLASTRVARRGEPRRRLFAHHPMSPSTGAEQGRRKTMWVVTPGPDVTCYAHPCLSGICRLLYLSALITNHANRASPHPSGWL